MKEFKSGDIEKLISKCETFANSKNIDLLYGEIEDGKSLTIDLSTTAYNFDDFLDIVSERKPPFIIIDLSQIYGDDIFDLSGLDIKRIELPDIKRSIRAKFKLWNSLKGETFICRFMAIDESKISYEYVVSSPRLDLWSEIKREVELIKRFYLKSYQTTVDDPLLTKKEIKIKAKEIAKNERFHLAKNDKQRSIIIEDLYEEEEIDSSSLREILFNATTYYEVGRCIRSNGGRLDCAARAGSRWRPHD